MNTKIIHAMKELQTNFYKIQCRNWIPSRFAGTGGAGRTLEDLLGLVENSDVLPDYEGIEIKTRYGTDKYPISLFSCAFDSQPMEMKRLLLTCGYQDPKYPDLKRFNTSMKASHQKYFRTTYSFRLKVDREKQVIKLRILNRITGEVDDTMSWSFKELKSRLEHKLSYLALVKVKKDQIGETVYYKYRDLTLYKLKGFETFIDLFEKGKISVIFKLSQRHTEEKYGEIYDKGTNFSIYEKDIELLFDKIEV